MIESPTGSQDLDAPYQESPEDLTRGGGVRNLRAPEWLQLITIVGLFVGAVYVGLDGRYLWSTFLAIAGTTFGLAFILRRMMRDSYDRF